MSQFSVRAAIEQFYPEYYRWNKYPADKCANIRKTEEQWGVLGNFSREEVVVDGVSFCCTEQLFQMMKFGSKEPLLELYQKRGMQIKMNMKKWTNQGFVREDWDGMLVDAMKFCLQTKYEQSKSFRDELERTKGLFIVEDQTSFPKKKADTWGTKRNGDVFEGPNLLGILLMELRDNQRLEYHLPDDALNFIEIIKENQTICK